MGDESRLAEAYARQGYYRSVTGDERAAIQAYDAALQAAQLTGNVDIQADVLAMKLVSLSHLGELAQAGSVMQEALALVPGVKAELVLARTLTNLSVYLSATGDLSRVAQLLGQTLAITRRLGNAAGQTIVLDNLGYSYVVIGLPEQGREALESALSIAQKIGFNKIIAYAQLNLGLAYIRLGNSLAARQVLEQAISAASGVDYFGASVGYFYLGLAEEVAGDPVAASEHFAEARRRLEALGMHGNSLDAQAGQARCFLRAGEAELALEYIQGVWEYLAKNSSQAFEFPILAYQTCAQVFAAVGDFGGEKEAVRLGYQEMLERARKISDPAWQKAFLENIPEHRAIAQAWAQMMKA
jgi:tetratricopeptide (TPR) repeat protein